VPIRILLTALLPALALVVLGCEVRAPYPRLPQEVVLRASNENAADMELYVMRGSTREHVAHVCGGGSVDVALEPRLVDGGEIRILAAPAGSGDSFQTGTITIGNRTYIQLDLGPVLTESTYEVRYGTEPDGLDLPWGDDT
jgi:hypothetical protein